MLSHKNRNALIGLICWLMVLAPNASYAIAFCALRDPNHQIFSLFPEATSYSSLVSRVDRDTKNTVGELLPFTLHNRELGQHTLYLALRDEQPLGLVHVRSESSNWGLIEIVWSLDLDLNVRGFRFQRCRDAACSTLEQEEFKRVLQGKSFEELQGFISADRKSIDTNVFALEQSAEDLAAAVVRSALKTISVTDLVWHAELAELASR